MALLLCQLYLYRSSIGAFCFFRYRTSASDVAALAKKKKQVLAKTVADFTWMDALPLALKAFPADTKEKNTLVSTVLEKLERFKELAKKVEEERKQAGDPDASTPSEGSREIALDVLLEAVQLLHAAADME